MGQTESRLNGSYTFAYMLNSNNSTTSQLMPHSDDDDDDDIWEESDYILKNPEFYGFMHQTTTIRSKNYRDSGYVLPYYHDNETINDLQYIDAAYYSNISFTNAVKQVATTKTITTNNDDDPQISFADIMLATPEKTIQEVHLSCRSIIRLDQNICMLTMIRKLDLSINHLTELPESIGYMNNLESLILSRNRLQQLPDTIGYLSNLVELDVSYNELEELTPCIGHLERLKTLSLEFNQLSCLPVEISGLDSLVSIDLSRNPLQVLPAEISKLPYLRRIRLDDCPFNTNIEYSLKHNAPSLVEICARIVKRKEIKTKQVLPDHMDEYVQSAKSCTFCNGPYYQSYVLRGRLMEKTEMHIPLQYTLCSAHWSSVDDRILSMFSDQPTTSTSVIYQPRLPNLPPCAPILRHEKQTHISRKYQQMALPVESNVTVDPIVEEIPAGNQLSPSSASTKNHTKINKSTLFNNFSSRFKKPW